MVNSLIFAGVLFLISGLFTQSQPDTKSQASTPANGQVEVKAISFNGAIHIKLKEASLLKNPDHTLLLSLEVILNPQSPGTESYVAYFYSYSKSAVRFGDMEIHCLIDGKPLSLNKADRPERDDRARSRASDEIYTLIALQDLEKIANGTKVEMRIGSVEWTIPSQSLQAIREFVDTARKYKESFKTKGRNNEK